MPEERTPAELTKTSTPPLIFISHDSRDAELAEAFSNLLKCVSAGMLKSFRSSDKSGSEGIEFGDEWYKTLMAKLAMASDVVCLITERSVGRPWILYEAGVAKGKMDTPVHGVALGVPLSRTSVGPFYQFQNSDDSEESLAKLVMQLCKRIPGLEPDEKVVRAQISTFKASEAEALKKQGPDMQAEKKQPLDDGASAKVLEEMKLVVRELPMQLEKRLSDLGLQGMPRRMRRFHPEIILEISGGEKYPNSDGAALLILCGVFREDFPWLYEIAANVYRTLQDGTEPEREEAIQTLLHVSRLTFHGPLSDMMGASRDMFSTYKDMPMVLDEYCHRLMANSPKKRPRVRVL
jgi:hypothetical protein